MPLLLVVLDGLDSSQADESLAAFDTNQSHALGVAAHDRNVTDRGPDQRTARTDQHDLVFIADLQRADRAAIAFRGLDCDDALAAAPLYRELVD